ncbi:MAG TPA: amidase [Burkholderiales bacterium]|nr:amidase [Burkholderiales bacterium]
MADLTRLPAAAAAAAIAAGQVRSGELVEACLGRIAALDGTLKAFITLCGDQALAEAQRADRERSAGRLRGPLHGVPVAIKDITLTAGIRTTFGSRVYENHVPDVDDACVAKLREAGAIIIGKTNTPEFAFGALCTNALQGPTANPYDASFSSGGSSGGSAAAVAAGMVPLAQGTDFGGSVRTPASFCGVVGLRPTPGRIPAAPKRFAWNAMSAHGILARDVGDAALMLEAMSGADSGDPLSAGIGPWRAASLDKAGPAQPRVAYSTDLGFAKVHSEVTRVFDRAIDAMRPLDLELVPGAPDPAGAQHAFETLRAGQLYASYAELCERHRERLSPSFLWNVDRGRGISAFDYLVAEAERSRLYEGFARFFRDHDILATVSAAVPPFPNTQENVAEIEGVAMANIIDYLRITYLISLVGFPAVSIPCGFTAAGLPIGMQLVARPFEETALLGFARRLERELGLRHRPPPHRAFPASKEQQP